MLMTVLHRCQQRTRQVALPPDAAADDEDFDPALPWLDGHVAAALADGAAPYLPEAERASMGVVRPSAGRHMLVSGQQSGIVWL